MAELKAKGTGPIGQWHTAMRPGCALLHREGVGDERQHQARRGGQGHGDRSRQRLARAAPVWAGPRSWRRRRLGGDWDVGGAARPGERDAAVALGAGVAEWRGRHQRGTGPIGQWHTAMRPGCALLHREGVGDERQHQARRGGQGHGDRSRQRLARAAPVWAGPRSWRRRRLGGDWDVGGAARPGERDAAVALGAGVAEWRGRHQRVVAGGGDGWRRARRKGGRGVKQGRRAGRMRATAGERARRRGHGAAGRSHGRGRGGVSVVARWGGTRPGTGPIGQWHTAMRPGCALLHREGVGDERQHQARRGGQGHGDRSRQRLARAAPVWAGPRSWRRRRLGGDWDVGGAARPGERDAAVALGAGVAEWRGRHQRVVAGGGDGWRRARRKGGRGVKQGRRAGRMRATAGERARRRGHGAAGRSHGRGRGGVSVVARWGGTRPVRPQQRSRGAAR
nr:spidroin-1-like [Aegilops tauschii subsp. strangulata]